MVQCIDYELSRGVFINVHLFKCLSRENYGSPKNFRRKSIEKIIDEIGVKKKKCTRCYSFQDETFLTMKKDKLKELSKAYKKHVNLPFIIEATIALLQKKR